VNGSGRVAKCHTRSRLGRCGAITCDHANIGPPHVGCDEEVEVRAHIDGTAHGAAETLLAQGEIGGPQDGHHLLSLRETRGRQAQAQAFGRAGIGFAALDALDGHFEQIGLADELGNESVARFPVDVTRSSLLLDAAGTHDHNPVGHGEGFFLIVGHEHEGNT